jgi:predicted O-linked N-acetylglucosamine transferase (SPINDLY family)
VGLEFFAASKSAEYVAKATALAHKLDALAKIRASMRQRMAASTLCDAKAYATTLEAAYRKMWHRWCRRRVNAPARASSSPPRVQQPSTSRDTEQDGTKGDMLQFFLSENSDLQFTVSKSALPPFLLEAAALANAGRVEQVGELLNEQAVEVVRQMADEDPHRTQAAFLLATLLKQTEQMQKAELWYKEVLKRQPHALVFFELAGICGNTGRLSEAVQHMRKAVDLSPDSSELWTTLAEYLIRTGQTREGIEILQKAVETSPDKVSHSKLLWHLHQLPEFDERGLSEEHRRWGRIHAPISKAAQSHDNDTDSDRRLRVGYISPDFCGHSVAYFFESLLDEHNRREVETYGYGNVAFQDQVTERLESKFDHYRNIYRACDEAAVSMIEQDRIDILVDLAGHTSDNRLGVLARKPAPIQVSYLGFPDTTGMEQVDYRFTDALADPPGAQEFYTEQLVYLPDGLLCYRPPDFAPPVTPLPALEGGCFTFGSFNNSAKINPRILDLWAQILKADERFRLLLKFGGGDDEGVKDHYVRQFERLGVNRQRIQICGRKSVIEHFQMYGQVDVALDTYPYNGTTTTCEAMLMGVPTISLVGRHHASRVGLSLLSRVGLDVFAALTPADYVGKAIAFAREPANLSEIRTSLRSMMLSSPLCDAKAYARNVEAAYRKMWHRWCESRGRGVPCEEAGAAVPSSATESSEGR